MQNNFDPRNAGPQPQQFTDLMKADDTLDQFGRMRSYTWDCYQRFEKGSPETFNCPQCACCFFCFPIWALLATTVCNRSRLGLSKIEAFKYDIQKNIDSPERSLVL